MIIGRKKSIMTFAVITVLVFTAVFCHTLARSIDTELTSLILNFIRTYIYIGIFSAWGVSVSRRIIQRPVKHTLIAVAVLAVFWITVREIKFRFLVSELWIRLLWYSYYIPLLTIPVLAIFVSMYIGRDESYRLKKQSFLLFLPSLALMALILTNDLHELAFRFPEGSAVKSERDYSYAPVFYITVMWIIVCAAASLIILVVKSRLANKRRLFWLPLIPFAVSVFHIVIYTLRLPFAQYVDDVAVFFSLVYISYFELCIQCSLIQSNSGYTELFSASVDMPISIVDNGYKTVYTSSCAPDYPVETMLSAAEGPVILDEGKRLHNMPIAGGRVIWTEDLSELLKLTETLEDRREELTERNALLEYEYEKEKKHKTVDEQNRLYDLLQSKTQSQLDEIDRLVQRYRTAEGEEDKRSILTYIVVLGSYIKRRKDFVLSIDTSPQALTGKLRNALGESYRSLRLAGKVGSFYTEIEDSDAVLDNITKAYDFFEAVTQAVFDSAKFINTSICRINGKLRISVITDCVYNGEDIIKQYPEAKVTVEDGSSTFALTLEGGDGE